VSAQTLFLSIDLSSDDASTRQRALADIGALMRSLMEEPPSRAGQVHSYEVWGSVYSGEDTRYLLAVTADLIQRLNAVDRLVAAVLPAGSAVSVVGGYESLEITTAHSTVTDQGGVRVTSTGVEMSGHERG